MVENMSTPWVVPQFVPFLGEQEAGAVAACVRSGWITEGPLCERFVRRIKEISGVRYGVLAPNGTLALYLALKACGVKSGDEVIVPDLTFNATATAVVMAGASPVFADVNEHGQMSWGSAQNALSDKTWGCLPVHLYGIGQGMMPGMRCIEDACQALGVLVGGLPCGSLGWASAFSFFADKTVTTGEGGFVGTNDQSVFDRLRYLRNQGRLDRGSFVHPRIGQNFRMTDIQAAVGLSQLDRMPEIVSRKRAVHAAYTERLSDVVRVLQPPKGSTHVPFRTVVFFERLASEAADFLRARRVEPRSAFHPLHRQPCFEHLAHDPRHVDENFAWSNRFWNHALCLPTFPGLSESQVETVCTAVRDFVNGVPT